MKKYDLTIISGGQTGVDVAALRAAQCLGLKTGGLAPQGFKTTAGPKPQLKETFKLTEAAGGYSYRTRRNIEESNATLILANDFDSSGTKLTIAIAEALGAPLFKLKIPDATPQGGMTQPTAEIEAAVAFVQSLLEKQADDATFKLNVAGNSSRTRGGIFLPAFIILAGIITQLAVKADSSEGATVQQLHARILNDPRMIQALVDNFDYYAELDPRRAKGLIL